MHCLERCLALFYIAFHHSSEDARNEPKEKVGDLKMRFKDKKAALLIIALSIAVILLAWMYMTRQRKTESVQKHIRKAESRESINEVENFISLDEADQKKAGIVVSSLKPFFHKEELKAYGIVLQAKTLIDMRNSYVEAKASVDTALAALDASRREYERLKAINADNKNISDKTLQSAKAVFRADEANAFASREKLQSVKDAAVLRWGKIIAGWIINSSPAFQRLIDMKDVLLQVTIPLDVHIEAAPRTINIQSTGKIPITAKLVSYSPVTDSRIQGISFFYVAPFDNTRLIPGMNVQALLPVGSEFEGVIIPFSSIVWRKGKAWAYRQKDEERFVREEVSTLNLIHDGYFVIEKFSSGDKVVIQGAQILLSAEVLKLQTGGVKKKEEVDED
jgi:hypothetical protein